MTDLEKQIWEKALRLLQERQHSKHELEKKLIAKFPGENSAIANVFADLERVELINDRRFMDAFISHLIQKPIGRLKIMAEAYKKGLDKEAVDQLLLNLEWSEEKSAKEALEEKEARVIEPDPRKRKMKLANFLRGRGFSEAVVYKLLR